MGNMLLVTIALLTLSKLESFAPLSSLETCPKFQCHNSRSGIGTASHFRRLSFSLSTEDIVADDEENSDEPSKEDFILNAGDLDDEVITEDDEDDLPGWYKLNERVKELRVKYRRSENDTGSPDFQ